MDSSEDSNDEATNLFAPRRKLQLGQERANLDKGKRVHLGTTRISENDGATYGATEVGTPPGSTPPGSPPPGSPPPGSPPPVTSDTDEVKSALQEITSLLNTVVKRVERVEVELQRQQCGASGSGTSSSSDSTPRRAKANQNVPLIVRSEVRKMYRTFLDDEEEQFTGFDLNTGVTFQDGHNKEVSKKLIKEVQAINPQFPASQIRAAVYTYYRTLNQESSIKRRGKFNERNKIRRRRERLLRKLQERKSTMNKSNIAAKTKEKWKHVLTADMMSSEESEDDDVIIIKPIPWRAGKVGRFFHRLDETSIENKTPQAKRQRKNRIISDQPSMRPQPSMDKYLRVRWAFIE